MCWPQAHPGANGKVLLAPVPLDVGEVASLGEMVTFHSAKQVAVEAKVAARWARKIWRLALGQCNSLGTVQVEGKTLKLFSYLHCPQLLALSPASVRKSQTQNNLKTKIKTIC